MRNKLLLAGLLLLGCEQIDEYASDYEVKYTVVVTNSDGESLDSVKIEVSTIDGSSYLAMTGSEGRAVFPGLYSMQNIFLLTKNNYHSAETVDVVSVPDDTTTTRILRVLSIEMDTIDSSSTDDSIPPAQYTLLVTDSVTSKALADVTIKVKYDSESEEVQTDSLGMAETGEIPSGIVKFTFVKSGYTSKVVIDTVDVESDEDVQYLVLDVKMSPVE